jgi:hypothetical protein
VRAKLFFICVILAVMELVAAQETKVVRDLRLWTGVKVEKDFARDWTVSLQEELRLKNNMSGISNYFTEVALQYRIDKHFALEGAYRFTRDRKKDNSYQNLSRYHFDFKYKGKMAFLTFDYRARYQREVDAGDLFDLTAPYEKYFRNRVGIKLNNLKKISPYARAEIFQLFTPYYSPKFEYWRLEAGILAEPRKMGEFRLAWGFNREIQSPVPAMIYVFKVNYTYSF